jgi:hypothetical protein
MPTNIKIIHAHEFVRATPHGVLDLKASEELLFDLMSKAASLHEFEILIDTRHAITVMDMSALLALAMTASKFRERLSRKTALLCPAERFDYARFFASCAEVQGVNVQAFSTYEQAMEWLAEEHTSTGVDEY